MATLADSPAADGCFADLPLVAQDVARGVTRLFFRTDFFALCEVPLPNGRRADMVAIARIAMADLADGGAPRALFFHARHVRPGWRLTRVATVGNHIFYR